MEYNFSNRFKNLKPSPAGDILATMGDPSLIKFSGGNPATDSFPIDKITEFSNEVLTNKPLSILEYGLTEGYHPLLNEAKKFFNRDGNVVKEGDMMICTSGSQQIADCLAKIICNEGDTVLTEDPSFLGVLDSIRSNGANLVGVNMEDDGIDLADLEEKLQIKPTPKFIYVIPNFQNPTGITMSLEKRKAVYDLCKKYNVLILEDNPYGQLRFSGEPLPPIKSFDEEGIVIYAASFSKIIAPGIRVACAVGKPEIIGALKKVKFLNDVHSTTWSQVICERILATCDMDAQIEKLKDIYGAKNKIMQEEMAKNFHPSVKYTKPEGGMFVWVTLPNGVDMMKFVGEALENKVALVPGTAFLADTSMPCQSFRMNFSTPSVEDIIKGIRILGELTYKYCK